MSKTLLLLGGSKQQVVAIEKAKELGYRTVLCDYLSDNPGQYAADSFYLVSTTDRDAVLEVAQSECVDGVLAYASDPAASTAAYVAEQLGLPSNPLSAVETLSEKHLFRAFLTREGFPCPKACGFDASSSYDDVLALIAEMEFPIVIKPTDSSGSKGVTVVHAKRGIVEACKHAASYSRNGILIAEEFIERVFPHVIGGDVFVVDGEIKFWGLMSCLRDSAHSLVPSGEVTPSGLTENQIASVKQVLQRLVDALHLKFGEFNVEIIIGKENVPYVLEFGARAGGNMIPVQLSDASGIDLISANIECAMGVSVGDIAWESDGQAFATYVIHSDSSGVFCGVEYLPEIVEKVYREVLYIEEGSKVLPFEGANAAIGIVFLRLNNEDLKNGFLDSVSNYIVPRIERS